MIDEHELADAIRELNGTLSSVIRVSAESPQRALSVAAPFNARFTTTGTIAVWTPSLGTKAVVKRVVVCGVVDVALNAGAPVAFYLADATTGEVVAPISAAAPTAAAGTLLPADGHPVVIDLREGSPASAVDVALVIRANATIDTGYVRFFGVVLGEEATR